MKVAELYADERRRSSAEAALGHDWASGSGDTFSVFWIEATGEVVALRRAPVAFGPGAVKPYGIYLPAVRPAYGEDEEATVLGTCTSLDELTEIAEEIPRTIEALRDRLAG